jgi:DNA-directed RNA polymerase specialized sigma24 family protein
MVPPVVPMGQAKPVNAAEPKPTQRRRAARREIRHIPPSQFGRIRALANYGMTQAEVAELYGVSVGEIERIVGRPEA